MLRSFLALLALAWMTVAASAALVSYEFSFIHETGSMAGVFHYDDASPLTVSLGDFFNATVVKPPILLPTISSATGDMVGFLSFDWSGAFILADDRGIFVEDGPSNTWFAFAFPPGGTTLNAPLTLANFDENGFFSMVSLNSITLARGSSGAIVHLSPVPIPAALPLLVGSLAGLGAIGWMRRGREKQATALN